MRITQKTTFQQGPDKDDDSNNVDGHLKGSIPFQQGPACPPQRPPWFSRPSCLQSSRQSRHQAGI